MGLTKEDIQLITEHNRQKGYIYCEECTKETNGNYDMWINPHKLCPHLKKKMSAQEIAEAVAKYDAHKDEYPGKMFPAQPKVGRYRS